LKVVAITKILVIKASNNSLTTYLPPLNNNPYKINLLNNKILNKNPNKAKDNSFNKLLNIKLKLNKVEAMKELNL